MNQLTPQGQQIVAELAERHGFSTEAVIVMLQAILRGNGSMAQFNHPEFGGSGQWMQGGMLMIGDMFNNFLKGRVDALCYDLSNHLASQTIFYPPPPPPSYQGQQQSQGGMGSGGPSFMVSGGNWWPPELGAPGASGSQNAVRYAYFPQAQRLAIEHNGRVTVYNTLDHQIGGFGQQQGGSDSLTFTSQYGTVAVASLPVVSPGAQTSDNTDSGAPPLGAFAGEGGGEPQDPFSAIERLGTLKERGLITEEEFAAKKAELLKRL